MKNNIWIVTYKHYRYKEYDFCFIDDNEDVDTMSIATFLTRKLAEEYIKKCKNRYSCFDYKIEQFFLNEKHSIFTPKFK